jgi:Fur family transcriptional regulator, peroxide stress response regulator
VNTSRQSIAGSFRARGLRCTPQRFAVLEYLHQHSSHPHAEDILEAVNRKDPRASRATVYNALHALVRAGLVREVPLAGHTTRFECHVERHHHFVCDRCGRIEDLEWFDLPGIAQLANVAPARLLRWELVLQGLCKSCSSPKKEKKTNG